MLLKFTIVCLSQRLDGFLIELPGDIYGASVQVPYMQSKLLMWAC